MSAAHRCSDIFMWIFFISTAKLFHFILLYLLFACMRNVREMLPFIIVTGFLFVFVRLIVVAEKQVVYEKFPIPLINRLEKHFLAMDTMLTEDQRKLADKLQHWAEQFCNTGRHQPLLHRAIRFLD